MKYLILSAAAAAQDPCSAYIHLFELQAAGKAKGIKSTISERFVGKDAAELVLTTTSRAAAQKLMELQEELCFQGVAGIEDFCTCDGCWESRKVIAEDAEGDDMAQAELLMKKLLSPRDLSAFIKKSRITRTISKFIPMSVDAWDDQLN